MSAEYNDYADPQSRLPPTLLRTIRTAVLAVGVECLPPVAKRMVMQDKWGELQHLARTGQFRRAVSLSAEAKRQAPLHEFEALGAELLAHVGDIEGAWQRAKRLLRVQPLSGAAEARMHLVLATIAEERQEPAKALTHVRRAIDIAEAVKDAHVEATARLAHLSFLIDGNPAGELLPNIADARKAVARTADPYLLVSTRLLFARAEVSRRSLREAYRHLVEVGGLLAQFPNVWLQARQQLGLSVIASLQGNLRDALSHAERAIILSREAGHIRTERAGLINLAHAHLGLGELGQARQYIDGVLGSSALSVDLRIAALDCLANLYLASDDLVLAEQTFTLAHSLSRSTDPGFRSSWYEVNLAETEARLKISTGKPVEAAATLHKAMHAAAQSPVWAARLRVAMLEVLAACRDWPSVAGTLGQLADDDLPPGAIARCSLAISGAPLSIGRRSAALQSARRLAEATTNTVLKQACEEGWPCFVNSAGADIGQVLDAIARLERLVRSPTLFALEAIDLLQQTGSFQGAAVVESDSTSVRVKASFGWHVDEARAQAEHPGSSHRIRVGNWDGKEICMLAQPRQDLNSECNWIALRRIFNTLLALEHSRTADEERIALWPADVIENGGEALWMSEAIRAVVSMAERAARSQATILITGETGTGKEMLARAIHLVSPRSAHGFVPFNCSATPRELLESQLFGYRKGAFTGADTGFPGVIRAAEGGTLFLDEIGDVPLELQPKLLRFLENREIHPLGEPQPFRVDIRIIAATNLDLLQLVASGRFREDLYYRLNVVPIRLPPLRERREEIPALVTHFIRRFAAQERKGAIELCDDALEYLILFDWPGNVRQLANEINRLVALAEPEAVLAADQLSDDIVAKRRTAPTQLTTGATPPSGYQIDPHESLPEAVDRLERVLVEAALRRSKGRVEDAARLLGISRKGLFLKRRRWGLAPLQSAREGLSEPDG